MEQSTRNFVGKQIQRHREAQGLSQQKLAVACSLVGYEITRSTLAKIEAEIRAVSDVELFVMAKALRLKIEALYPSGFAEALRRNEIVPFHTRRNRSDDPA